MSEQSESNQTFLRQQSEASGMAIKAMAERFADEIRNMGKEVAALRGAGAK